MPLVVMHQDPSSDGQKVQWLSSVKIFSISIATYSTSMVFLSTTKLESLVIWHIATLHLFMGSIV